MEFESKMTSVYPIKAKIISYGSSNSIKTLIRKLHWGRKDLGLEHGNPVQTPATPDATKEE